MFFDTAPANKSKNKNVTLTKTQLPKPKEVELISFDQLQGSPTNILDCECYPNYFSVGFKFLELEKYCFFEQANEIYSINGVVVSFDIWRNALSFLLHRFLSVSFNGIYYDLPLIFEAMRGKTNLEIKHFSNELINARKWTNIKLNHIDVMEVAPLHDGLKTYAGRIHVPRMQELPYHHEDVLTDEQIYFVRSYNVNDLDNTGLLYLELKGQIRLREKLGKRYSLDLRSKSDAQVAEAVIQTELNKAGIRTKAPSILPGTSFFYSVPDFIKFDTPQLQHVLEVVRTTPFVIGNDGSATTPKEIRKLKIRIGTTDYQMGNGGLHSKEECVTIYSTDKIICCDRDFSSYYPAIILKLGLYPNHLGIGFCEIYQNILNERLNSKKRQSKIKEQIKLLKSKIFELENGK